MAVDEWEITEEVLEEIKRQAQKGYDLRHDLEHGLWHLESQVYHRAEKVIYRADQPRRELLEIAAVCVAAIRAIDSGVNNQPSVAPSP